MTGFMTIQEMVAAARRKLAPEVWDHLSGGAESETTLRCNRQALAAGGAQGIVRALEILEAEIVAVMRLLGVTRLDRLGPQHLCRAAATGRPTELSAFHLLGEIPFPDH